MAIYQGKRKYYKYVLQDWTQPKLTSDTSYGKVSASNVYGSVGQAYRAVDGVKSGGGDLALGWLSGATEGWWKWELPVKISVSSIKYYNTYASASSAVTGQFFIDEGVTPLTNSFSTSSSNWASYTLPSVNNSLTNVIYFKKTAGGNYGGIGELEITAQEQIVVESTADDHDYSLVEADKMKDVYSRKQNTNCLLNIPQDIKLELTDGTLTLKAGSKVYVPNGFEQDGTTPKFDVRIIESDTNVEAFGVDGDVFQFMFAGDSRVFSRNNAQVFSGSTAPTGQTYMVWYDTTNNLIKHTSNSGSTWSAGGDTFPLSISSTVSLSYTSIKQIFNGFGSIDSTFFTLPGVKGLIPDGKNADGSLKNIEFTVDKVITTTRTYITTIAQTVNIANAGKSLWFANGYIESTSMPTTNNYILWYNPKENVLRFNNSSTSVTDISQYPIVNDMLHVATTGTGDGTSKITSFTPKSVEDYTKKARIVAAYKTGKTETKPNVTVVGSPTINGSVVSGFSSSNYLNLPNKINVSDGSTWEMVFKITTAKSTTTYEMVLGDPTNTNYLTFFGVSKNSKVQLLITNNNSSFIVTKEGITVLEPETQYYIKAEFTGSEYNIYQSKNGTEWTLEGTVTTSAVYTLTPILRVGFGASTGHPFNGSIDLSQSYININGSRWWSGMHDVIEPQLVYNLKYNLNTSSAYTKVGTISGTNKFGTDKGLSSTTSLNQTSTFTFNTSAPSGKWTGKFIYYSQVNFNMSQVYWQLTYDDGTKEYAYGPTSLADTAYGGDEKATISLSFTAKKPIKTVTVYAKGAGSGSGCYGGLGSIQMFFDGSTQ